MSDTEILMTTFQFNNVNKNVAVTNHGSSAFGLIRIIETPVIGA